MAKDCMVGVKGLICVDNSYLILQKGSGEDGYWDIPGGRIDGGETLEETLHRELHEELPSLGTYKVSSIVGAYRLSHDIAEDKGLVLLFYKIEAEPFEVTLSEEHSGYQWITKETLSGLLNAEYKIEPGYFDVISRVLSED